MKNKSRQTPDNQRRAFLRGTAGAGVGVAALAALPGLTAASVEEASEDQSESQKGYRLTPHIAAYYKTTIR
ncbi:MAG: formate dehydrogenase [Candidatus Thiodiazotropha sp. (ex Ctena orbiculata)]|nr:formate dehydrogenase [Candidatus Thiodiazotropha taylori]